MNSGGMRACRPTCSYPPAAPYDIAVCTAGNICRVLSRNLIVPLLGDLAVGQHNNVVRVLDGGQPVRDDQHRADGPHLFQRILNQKLGLGVNFAVASSRIITLGLWMIVRASSTTGCPAEVVPALADLLVRCVVQLVNELVGVDIAADL